MAKILDPDLLTYSVNSVTNNLRFDTTDKTIELVAGGSLIAKDGVTGQCLFSKIKEAIKASADLISVALPVREMIHDESMELINGWRFKDTSSLKMIRDCGVAYVNTSGVITHEFACFVTLGEVATGTSESTDLYFVQDSATDAALSYFTHLNTATTFGVNELVPIYESGVFDRRSYCKVFLRRAGYTYDESSNADIGYPTLTYKKYNFPVTHAVDAGVTVDDTTLDGVGYSALAIQWYATAQSAGADMSGGPYNFHVLITGDSKSYDQIYSWVQRQLRKSTDIDAGAGNRTGRVAPALVTMDGTTLKTLYQSGLGGVHIVSPAASSWNNIQERDDTNSLRSYPLSVSVQVEFDSYLKGDADSQFWIFPTSAYGSPGAAVLTDASSNNMSGAATADTSFAYIHSTNVPVTGIAMGLTEAKIAVATGTITEDGVKLVFVAGTERWYSDPA
jgi:hypothetical protein